MSKELEQKIMQKIEGILSQQCVGVKRTRIMTQLEGLSIIHAITSMVSEIEKEKQALIDHLKEENKKLRSLVNQFSFRSDPARDGQLLQLHQMGLSRKQIGKRVWMSAWGVSEALTRPGVNQVDGVKKEP